MQLLSSRHFVASLIMIMILAAGCSHEPTLTHFEFKEDAAIKTAPANYYDTVDTSTPAALRVSLHEIIDDHTRLPYTDTDTDTWNVLELADEDPNDSGRILDVYLNASYPKYGEGNLDYNREHTWPSSFGFPDELVSNYPYTDCHQLMLCNDSYNSSRGNKPFATVGATGTERPTEENDGVGGGIGIYPGWSNWYSTTYWETWLDRRGDVARALLYLDVRYEGGTHSVTGHAEPDLILTDELSLIEASNTGNNEPVAYMGLLTDLLAWHQADPVDAKEMARNDVVFTYQGNRNPFIDNPDWADCVFGGNCGGGDTTPPAAPTGLTALAGGTTVDLDWDDNGESDLWGYTVYRATASGGPYSTVNGTLLTVSEFADTGLTGGTTYYYVVTATDFSENDSSFSNEASATPIGGGPLVWINELHYDNVSIDTGEFFEIAGVAGTDLTDWHVMGYNGYNGENYNSKRLKGVIPDQEGGFGTLVFTMVGIQNGSPDGLALIDATDTVIQFISYEGTFIAVDGPAAGMVTVDIEVNEPDTTPIGHSLQLAGTGSTYDDFSWQEPQAGTPGQVNIGQSFTGEPIDQALHVAAITLDTKLVRRKEFGTSLVLVVDDQGSPVADVTVTGTFSGGANGTAYAVTDADGEAFLTSPKGGKVGISFGFCVDNVALGGYAYDSDANAVTCVDYGVKTALANH